MKAVAEQLSDVVVAVDVEPAHWLELKREHQIVRQQLRTKWLFRCPDCDHPVYPKNSLLGTQFFAHALDAPDMCPLKALEGESAEHKQTGAAVGAILGCAQSVGITALEKGNANTELQAAYGGVFVDTLQFAINIVKYS